MYQVTNAYGYEIDFFQRSFFTELSYANVLKQIKTNSTHAR